VVHKVTCVISRSIFLTWYFSRGGAFYGSYVSGDIDSGEGIVYPAEYSVGCYV